MNQTFRRRPRQYHPLAERFEDRLLLDAGTTDAIKAVLHSTTGASPVRPNTPVLPFGSTSAVATFVDPSARITYGKHIEIGVQTYVAPYATLNAGPPGFIKIGNASSIQDDAVILGNPNRLPGAVGVVIGDNVVIGPGATVRGPAQVGNFGPTAGVAYVGANALIDGGNVAPGAIVGALARVGPGVTIPSGFRVLPGVNVTTQAEASNPALGFVVPVVASDLTTINQMNSDNAALASGYTTLYQGNSATGVSPGVLATILGVNSANLANVTGTSPEPGTTNVKFEPASQSPKFQNAFGQEVQAAFPTFRARVIGQVIFKEQARIISHRFGRGNSIRGDEGQPITIGSIAQTGFGVSIHAPISGTITIGTNLTAGDNSRILGGPGGVTTSLGNNVVIGSGAVVDRSAIGTGSTIGARAYVSGSTLAPGTVVPPGTILVNNKVVGTIQW